MFVDASAIVAVLTREFEADALADVRERARSPITSPIAIFEATLGIPSGGGVRAVPITGKEAEMALNAFSRYGKGRCRPARLNLGDCFAYAVAKSHRTTLLFKGEDFDKTDIRPAAPSHLS